MCVSVPVAFLHNDLTLPWCRITRLKAAPVFGRSWYTNVSVFGDTLVRRVKL